MIKVIIVDDEYLLREGLKNTIPWERYGMEVVGMAENGEDGLALAEEYQPDFIVTDICMPFMNGLEMAGRILRDHPDTSFVVLTSYDEFEYARKALQLGAADYLLKPVNLEDFKKLLEKAQQKYLKLQQRHNSVGTAISGVVHGRELASHLQASLEQAGMPSRQTYCCLMFKLLGFGLAQNVLSANELREMLAQFGELLTECCGQQLLLEGQEEEGRYLVVLSADSPEHVCRMAEQLCRNVRQKERIRDEYPLLCAISDPMTGEEQLATAYWQCKQIVQTSFLYNDTQFIQYSDMNHRKEQTEDISGSVDAFTDALRSFDMRIIQKKLEEISKGIRASGQNSLLYGHVFVASTFSSILKTAQEVGVEMEDFFQELRGEYYNILLMDNLSAQIQKIGELAGRLCQIIKTNKKSPHISMIQKAKNYVENNYTDSTLTLRRVSEEVHMSPSYFSIVFKQTVGKSFISYLTDLRMEQAAHLLQNTSQKVYEIGYAVGYENPTYFSTLFKRNFGVGPAEYRQRLTANGNTRFV